MPEPKDLTYRDLVLAFHNALRGPDGETVLRALRLAYGGQSYVQGDTHETAYRAGQRSVLLDVESRLATPVPDEETD